MPSGSTRTGSTLPSELSSASQRQILTVTKLNRLARTILESEIGLVWLSAEISNFVCAASGHWYFTLKDQKAQVRAAMFRNTNRLIQQRPKEGDKVLVRASVGLYEARGDYQLVVEHMESDGEGQLKQAFEALKARLYAEGLFDQAIKRPLPRSINRIGIVTSASGAALHDALTVLARRSPATNIIVYPSMVQGESAAQQLIQALHTANRRQEVDVILLTRGGGSLEDLWCFNDEALARAILASEIPVVSAVGHEVDVTIADFVADLRAPTPSAGAELLSQDQSHQRNLLADCRKKLLRSFKTLLQSQQHRLQILSQRLRTVHPANRIQAQNQSLDRLQIALYQAMKSRLSLHQRQFERATQKLTYHNPQRQLVIQKQRLTTFEQRLSRQIKALLNERKQNLAGQVHLLQSVSPLSTLTRGYSITFKEQQPLTRSDQVKVGDTITTRLKSGQIISEIKGIEGDNKP
ncbi:exodeoxyribonuclease VII large subunit [Alteromonas aestuariivivens]|uniref:Exodeoxyribonuclease 7 large subunit n=1 Tax=Alteromonas aestuariivivens TaxID=1938339 RepID=A0A3D8MGW0_9ALTE|nr:exodeoxyribonuclease VII large subunit [Alteromonas aestuariivivens]RDV29438.1 exodeoxyribonuclease VII large subunit [Alteromonas aestuariivivens]